MHFRHDWREVGRHYNPPARNARDMEIDGCQREGCTERKVVEHLGRLPERTD